MLAVMLIVPHVSALLVLPWLTIPYSVIILLAGIIFASLYQALMTHVLFRSEKSITALIWDMSAGLKVTDREGNVCEALIKDDLFVHPYLIILNLQLFEGGKRTLVLLPDSAEGELLRRLRVRLLLDGLPKGE
jgi:Membrane-bound toxin component of toxin-antitoxin system